MSIGVLRSSKAPFPEPRASHVRAWVAPIVCLSLLRSASVAGALSPPLVKRDAAVEAAGDEECPARLRAGSITLSDVQEVQAYADYLAPADREALLDKAKSCIALKLRDAVDTRSEEADEEADKLERALAYINVILSNKDPRAFRLALYGATTYSNLYRDATKDTGYFATSRPSVVVELSQVFTNNLRWESYGNIGLATKAAVKADALTGAISSSSSFTALAGVRWWLRQPNYAWILVGLNVGAGVVGIPSSTPAGSSIPNDHFDATYEAGVTFKQASGSLADSYSQFGYFRDPQFQQHPNRFSAKVRFVYTPQTVVSVSKASSSEGATSGSNAVSRDALSSGLGGFLEGLVSLGTGPEEVRITLGLKLSIDSVFKAVFGTGTTPSQPAAKASN